MRITGPIMHFVTIYAPTKDASITVKHEFENVVRESIDQMSN